MCVCVVSDDQLCLVPLKGQRKASFFFPSGIFLTKNTLIYTHIFLLWTRSCPWIDSGLVNGTSHMIQRELCHVGPHTIHLQNEFYIPNTTYVLRRIQSWIKHRFDSWISFSPIVCHLPLVNLSEAWGKQSYIYISLLLKATKIRKIAENDQDVM